MEIYLSFRKNLLIFLCHYTCALRCLSGVLTRITQVQNAFVSVPAHSKSIIEHEKKKHCGYNFRVDEAAEM